MLTIGQVKRGQAIVYENEPCLVVDFSHSKMGRGHAVARLKIKSLKSGKALEVTYQGNDKITEADLTNKRVQFLYRDQAGAHFMDENYEQISLGDDLAGDCRPYLKEGVSADIVFWENRPVAVKLPPKVDLKVAEAAPAVRGDTATSANKTVKLETGLEVLVPMFIKEGDTARINTETGLYVERV